MNNVAKSSEIEQDEISLPISDQEIQQQTDVELNNYQNKMIYLGGILSTVIGFFFILTLRKQVYSFVLLAWFIALILINRVNVWVAHRNRNITPLQTLLWFKARREYHIILGLLCLTWGYVGVLYTADNAYYQLYVITSLQLLLVGFSFGTVTDFTACIVSNICLLIPYMGYRLYLAFSPGAANNYDTNLQLSFCVSLLLLATFLVCACYFGYRLIKSFFKLSFENVALNKKLENVNKFLEQRVQERTIELENSLKLVTYQATHDLLTDLPNQRLLIEQLQTIISSAQENKQMFAVACLYINQLEQINDAIGHSASDQVLKTIAMRFKTYLTDVAQQVNGQVNYTVTISRKDVFVIILNPVWGVEEIDKIAAVIFSVFNEPVYVDKQAITITASIGMSLYPRDGIDAKTLLMNADAAMSIAKTDGGNSLNIYKAAINAEFLKKLEIENHLHHALKNNEFVVYYQPFIDLKTGYICGAEVLVRWNNPVLGFLSPDKFIALAEESGIIISLGEWVMNMACQQAKEWQQRGFKTIKIAINLSAKQLLQKDILQRIAGILQETALDPAHIELELTESEAFLEETISTIKQFKAMGLSLSIDDFGTGYSGLSNLKLFAIDKLKIDKSFIRDVTTNSDSKVIVENTIRLAKKIKVAVLAEGVETKEQLQFLKEHNCDMIQGYYFSPPVDADSFAKLLENENKFVDDCKSI